jgi:hypothetical protein
VCWWMAFLRSFVDTCLLLSFPFCDPFPIPHFPILGLCVPNLSRYQLSVNRPPFPFHLFFFLSVIQNGKERKKDETIFSSTSNTKSNQIQKFRH